MTALRQRMLEDMKIRNLAQNTQDSYLLQVSQFARHFGKYPEMLGPEDIRAYQLHLTQEKKLAPGSITIAVSALRFLYKVTLHRRKVARKAHHSVRRSVITSLAAKTATYQVLVRSGSCRHASSAPIY